MGLQLITYEAGYPLTDAEIDQHIHRDSTDDAAVLSAYKFGVLNALEKCLRRSLGTATYVLWLENFPYLPWESPVGNYTDIGNVNLRAEIDLPLPPVSSVTSVEYLGTDGVPVLMSPTDYQVDLHSCPASIQPASGGAWPATMPNVYNAVQIRYTCGYGFANVPFALKTALLLGICNLWSNRESIGTGTIGYHLSELEEYLVGPYKHHYVT